MEIITADTGITIGVVVLLVSFTVWITKVWFTSRGNKEDVGHIRKRLSLVEVENSQMLDRMARIETKIDILIDHLNKSKE